MIFKRYVGRGRRGNGCCKRPAGNRDRAGGQYRSRRGVHHSSVLLPFARPVALRPLPEKVPVIQPNVIWSLDMP